MASRSGRMPPVAVYFVLFSSMALMAAFLMCSGVGKSGSPGPKSATSTPRAFSFSASAITADVGEIWMRLMRSVRCTYSVLFGAAQQRILPINLTVERRKLKVENRLPKIQFGKSKDGIGRALADFG